MQVGWAVWGVFRLMPAQEWICCLVDGCKSTSAPAIETAGRVKLPDIDGSLGVFFPAELSQWFPDASNTSPTAFPNASTSPTAFPVASERPELDSSFVFGKIVFACRFREDFGKC